MPVEREIHLVHVCRPQIYPDDDIVLSIATAHLVNPPSPSPVDRRKAVAQMKYVHNSNRLTLEGRLRSSQHKEAPLLDPEAVLAGSV